MTTFEKDVTELLAKQQESEPRFTHQAMIIARRTDEAEAVVAKPTSTMGMVTISQLPFM